MTIYNDTPPTDLLIIAQGAFNDATDNPDMAYQERLLAIAESQAAAQIATAKLLLLILSQPQPQPVGWAIHTFAPRSR